jgi:D-glycero-D-manno-heptose 1,7-bisphosphate phosphatase
VFLDRDGVINRKPPEGEYISTWTAFELLPGVENAIAILNRSGRNVFVVTNQRGVALGLYSEADVQALHRRLDQHLRTRSAHIDGYYYCPHDTSGCNCRKPLPGLFEQAFGDHVGTGPESSAMIGDSLSDIEAGRALGIRTIFIKSESRNSKPESDKAIALADIVCSSLDEAVQNCFAAR